MLKHLSICAVLAALAALGAGPLYAQGREVCLKTVEVPGAGFDFVLATPTLEGGALPNLEDGPDALVMHLRGGKLLIVFDEAGEMVRALDSAASPDCAYEGDGKGGMSLQPVALYVVPKRSQIAGDGTMVDVRAGTSPRWPSLVPNDTAGLP